VRKEFERILLCGRLSAGFSRLVCKACGFNHLLAFSCKGRLCPSCANHRMEQTALFLTARVLPKVPFRQWTVSLPWRIRWQVGTDAKLLGAALSVMLRRLFAWQRRAARRAGIAQPVCGSVTFIHRFNSQLLLSPHFHALLPDGVFVAGDDGALRFEPLPPPSDDEVELLLRRVSKLQAHLAMEDEHLYPKLLTHADEAVRDLARQYVDEMGGLRERIRDYDRRWISPSGYRTGIRTAEGQPSSNLANFRHRWPGAGRVWPPVVMAVTRVVDESGRVIEYERRRPENSVYYRIVQEHIQTVFSQAEENGSGYPTHVKREFERFMSCGVLAAGFARIHCAQPGCTSERLVAYAAPAASAGAWLTARRTWSIASYPSRRTGNGPCRCPTTSAFVWATTRRCSARSCRSTCARSRPTSACARAAWASTDR
jgi:hypothetical protein